ncbi:sulfatase family protein [Euzebyella saccharophila]|uniref:Sulfatase n=1 Tax=Euzebyella saccharophila TaxID=679664 RepID=A0ABV8JM69_9FLAO|nr:sulfatase [Euzebyella saccharophila]
MKKLIVIAGLVLVCLISCKEQPDKTSDKKAQIQYPNIVFILSDDQAWTDYGFMGHEHIETPNIDKLARESRTFTRGYVPTSLCSPSLASIITGVYPRNHMVLANDRVLPGDEKNGKPAWTQSWRAKNYEPVIENFKKLNTLPDFLKEKGYLSFQTGKWWIGNYENGGFDYGMTHGNPNKGGRHGDYGLEIGRKGMDTLYSYIDLALEKKKPFFMWYAPFLPHAPHNPPEALLQKYLPKAPSEYVAKYWAMCEWFDQTCGDLINYIDEKGETENTIFVYVCDNGWVQNENNSTYDPVSKRSPYDLGMRTPIMYKWKGKITPEIDAQNLVSSLDMVPTVLDLIGLERPDDLDGINVLNEAEQNKREAVYGEIYEHDFNTVEESLNYRIVMTNPYKLILPNPENKPNEKVQLFNIYEDPLEENNLAPNNKEVVSELQQILEETWVN